MSDDALIELVTRANEGHLTEACWYGGRGYGWECECGADCFPGDWKSYEDCYEPANRHRAEQILNSLAAAGYTVTSPATPTPEGDDKP